MGLPRNLRWLSYPAMIVVWLGLTGIVVILLVVWSASPTDDKWSQNLLLEVAKAGIQLLAVGVLGGALGFAWKALATEKEKEAERRAKVRSELLDIVALYNNVKSVRRSLRSIGLDPKYNHQYNEPPPSADIDNHGNFTKCQAQDFQEQMRTLNTLQLDFESKKRQFSQTDFLGEETPNVVANLEVIEKHLNKIVKEVWEKGGGAIQAGVSIEAVSTKLISLFDTIEFREAVSDPLGEITRIINKHVFGEASSETQSLVKSLNSEAVSARTRKRT